MNPPDTVPHEERSLLGAILDTVEALVVVLNPNGRILRFNRACEEITGYSRDEVVGKQVGDLFIAKEDRDCFTKIFEQLREGCAPKERESYWLTRDGSRRLIGWSTTVVRNGRGAPRFIIAAGIDRTESKRLEKTILEISGREHRRIGQDLHDNLGQHLTGIAFLSKVQERKLADKSLPEAAEAAKIVHLVNRAIRKTRELARGLVPVLSESNGLMSALEAWAGEVEDLFHIECRFECDDPVLFDDDDISNHLYRIAQEAVHNAIKHGKARNVRITLTAGEDQGALTIRDDGCGIPAAVPHETEPRHNGMGLHIMRYRADMIGGALHIEPNRGGGTSVTCIFPRRNGIEVR
ncbi:MAG: PAS domain S-box protein [Bryobacteraceae bacterium]